jgi:GNAT superfamily N-acetyltransferase
MSTFGSEAAVAPDPVRNGGLWWIADRQLCGRMAPKQPSEFFRLPDIRLARNSDLNGLLALFDASKVSQYAQPIERANRIWDEILENGGIFVFIAIVDEIIVATCTLITAPNLLRQGRLHGFLENVVTHPDHQGRGFGTAVVSKALDHAWAMNCHHVLMQSGRPDPRVHAFYERLGFKPGRFRGRKIRS